MKELFSFSHFSLPLYGDMRDHDRNKESQEKTPEGSKRSKETTKTSPSGGEQSPEAEVCLEFPQCVTLTINQTLIKWEKK